MKFYYNGELVRTSKNHHYTHAIFNVEKNALVSCHASEDLARKAKASEISGWRSGIENGKRMVKAFESGKSYYRAKVGNREFTAKIGRNETLESLQQWVESREAGLKNVEENWQIVELEER